MHIVYVHTRLIGLQIGTYSCSLINRLMKIIMTQYFYTKTAKNEKTIERGKGRAGGKRGRGRHSQALRHPRIRSVNDFISLAEAPIHCGQCCRDLLSLYLNVSCYRDLYYFYINTTYQEYFT